MQNEKSNLLQTNKLEADIILENDSKKEYDLMRDYANQLNGEIVERTTENIQ